MEKHDATELTRPQLNERIWAEPASKVTQELGIIKPQRCGPLPKSPYGYH